MVGCDDGTGVDAGDVDAGDVDAGGVDAGLDAHIADAGVLPEAPLSTLVCELSERPGPIPQPPMMMVADFGDPVRLSLNDPCSQDAVEVSPDGNRIYHSYAVNDINLLVAEGRQVPGTEVRFQDRLSGDAWGEPRVLDLRNGLPDSLNGETRVAQDGSWVIWHSLTAENIGYVDGLPAGQLFDLDLYEATMVNAVPGPAVHLGREVNSVYLEGEHWATDDGRTIYFASNRPGGLGGVDIWRISRDAAGAWGSAEPLPAPVNSDTVDMQPTLSPDGAFIYFASDRGGPIWIWRVAVEAGGSFGAVAEQILGPYVGEPTFASDGRLFFVHVEIDFSTGTDIYDADIYYVDPR